jgi:mannose-6-phosphate isomerase-like protein (cupin superfamily)
VKPTDIRDLVHFSPDGARRHDLFETTHLWSEVVCLQDNQRLGPIGDERSDGLVVVLAGRIAVQVGKGRARIGQWESVTVPAGSDLTLANASDEASVVLLVTAPPPAGDGDAVDHAGPVP